MCIEWNSINLASNALLHIFIRKTKSSPYGMQQNMSLGSIVVDRVHSLRIIPI